MGAFEAGGGAGGGAVASVSPLARMWRSVYAKAAEAAAVRMAALLRDHVYLFHRAAGGGGGATAGWVLLEDRDVAPDGADFTDLPQTYRDLRFVLEGRADGTGGATGRVGLHLNGVSGDAHPAGGLYYRSTLHYAQPGTPTHGLDSPAGSTGATDYYALLGLVPAEGAAEAGATGVIDLTLYGYARADRYPRYYALNTLTGAAANGAQTRHASGEFRSTAAVTEVYLFVSATTGWAAGTTVRVYGWTDG